MATGYLDDFEETSSEHPCEMDTDGSEDNESESRSDQDDECGNVAALQPSLVYNCPWATDLCPPSVRASHRSSKCVCVSSPSPSQTFRRLFCGKVFTLILEQTNIYERQKYPKARDAKRAIGVSRS